MRFPTALRSSEDGRRETMRFTVKNCPDSEWKRGFEKELRKRIDLVKKFKPCPASLTEICCFKEILGERT
jgi:hypothetical protein